MNDWRDHAACRDVEPELFYPKAARNGARTMYREPIQVCRTCPVRTECLEWAYTVNDQWAVLGGLSPRQRAKTRAAHMRSRQAAS